MKDYNEEYAQLEIGDVIHYDDTGRYDRADVFTGVVEQQPESSYLRIRVTKWYVRSGHTTNTEFWRVGDGVVDKECYKLLAPTGGTQQPTSHIAGLSPETIDWDAHKAFGASL